MYRLYTLSLLCVFLISCQDDNLVDPTNGGYSDTIFFISDRDGHNQIYAMDMDGSNQRRITRDTLDYYHPQFSPDGSRILFYSHVTGNDEIFTMDTSGNDLHNLSNTPGNDNMAQFSPDGAMIVFTSDRDGGREIYSMNADGSGQTRLTDNTYPDYCPTYSPDGTKIIFYQVRVTNGTPELSLPYTSNNIPHSLTTYGSYEVYKMDADGGNLTRLTPEGTYTHQLDFTMDYSVNTHSATPRFSPDGSKIVFTSYTMNLGFDVHMMDANGHHATQLTTGGTANCEPYFTPDGEKILFRTHRAGSYDLYTMDLDGGNLTNLTPDSDHCYFSQFSPDGEKVLFGDEFERTHWYKIFIMDADGGNRVRLTDNWYNDLFPIFQPSD
ncbi:TolB family protein [Candidatus Neomarinimicrobiota bacterium]